MNEDGLLGMSDPTLYTCASCRKLIEEPQDHHLVPWQHDNYIHISVCTDCYRKEYPTEEDQDKTMQLDCWDADHININELLNPVNRFMGHVIAAMRKNMVSDPIIYEIMTHANKTFDEKELERKGGRL